jgi:hypothetical protein
MTITSVLSPARRGDARRKTSEIVELKTMVRIFIAAPNFVGRSIVDSSSLRLCLVNRSRPRTVDRKEDARSARRFLFAEVT